MKNGSSQFIVILQNRTLWSASNVRNLTSSHHLLGLRCDTDLLCNTWMASPAPSLTLSLGAVEVGCFINAFLYGITTVQVYIYFTRTSHIQPLIRLMVTTIWLFDTANSCFIAMYLYYVTVTHFGDREVLSQNYWSLGTSAVFIGAVGAVAQGYFAYRIHVISRTWIITCISWILSLLTLIMSSYLTVVSTSSATTQEYFASHFGWLVTTCLVLMHVVDCINTAALCFYLRIGKNGSKKVDSVINKMFLWTIETGLVTVVAALLMLVFSQTMKKTSLWICVSVFYSKLYSNSLMAMLNGRESLRVSRLINDAQCNTGAPEWTYPTFNSDQTQIGLDDLEEPKKAVWREPARPGLRSFLPRFAHT